MPSAIAAPRAIAAAAAAPRDPRRGRTLPSTRLVASGGFALQRVEAIQALHDGKHRLLDLPCASRPFTGSSSRQIVASAARVVRSALIAAESAVQ
jgi:hypothetical protein